MDVKNWVSWSVLVIFSCSNKLALIFVKKNYGIEWSLRNDFTVLFIPYFRLLVFGILVTLVAWFSFRFFRLAHLALQNVKKDCAICSYFCNFVAKSDQKPKTKNGMNETKVAQNSNSLWRPKQVSYLCSLLYCFSRNIFTQGKGIFV